MDKIKNSFGLYKNKDIIYIKTGDYENSDKYKNCYCLECGDKLVPKMGKKNTWHFAHFSNKNCKTSFESGLHIYAKEVIKHNNRIRVPGLSIGGYFEDNQSDVNFLDDMHKWERENKDFITKKPFLEANIYKYKWISSETKIGNFVPDCIIEINGKKVAIEFFVTHEVDEIKKEKVFNQKIDMIEIYLGCVQYEINNEGFDLDQYILNNAISSWIYKTRIENKEKEIYDKIYNTKKYIVNEKYTRPELIKKREIEIQTKRQEEEEQRQNELIYQKKLQYVKDHRSEYENKKKQKIKELVEKYRAINQSMNVNVCNIPVKGEYAFDCEREVWQKKIYDKFILNREGSIIQLGKIIFWIENYSFLTYYSWFDTYNKNEIWNSKYDAVKEYLKKLEGIGVLLILDGRFTQWAEIKVIDSNKKRANLKLTNNNVCRDDKPKFCSHCGLVFEQTDNRESFYIDNFGVDKECFDEILRT